MFIRKVFLYIFRYGNNIIEFIINNINLFMEYFLKYNLAFMINIGINIHNFKIY